MNDSRAAPWWWSSFQSPRWSLALRISSTPATESIWGCACSLTWIHVLKSFASIQCVNKATEQSSSISGELNPAFFIHYLMNKAIACDHIFTRENNAPLGWTFWQYNTWGQWGSLEVTSSHRTISHSCSSFSEACQAAAFPTFSSQVVRGHQLW